MRPSCQDVEKLLDYDPLTGVFLWKITTGKARKGKRAGTIRPDGYRSITIAGQRFLSHRLAWLLYYCEWPTGNIDHRDRTPGNDWIGNLRQATHTQNMRNGAGRTGGSSFRGVSKNQHGGWRARIRLNREIHIGHFRSEVEAARAYDAAARKYHGEFACLNFPEAVSCAA